MAFGQSGLLLCAFYLTQLALISSTAFVGIFVMLPLVLYTQALVLSSPHSFSSSKQKQQNKNEGKNAFISITNQQ